MQELLYDILRHSHARIGITALMLFWVPALTRKGGRAVRPSLAAGAVQPHRVDLRLERLEVRAQATSPGKVVANCSCPVALLRAP